MVKHQMLLDGDGCHDNVSHVVFDGRGKMTTEGGEEGQLVQALEGKYDALKDKLIEAVRRWFIHQ